MKMTDSEKRIAAAERKVTKAREALEKAAEEYLTAIEATESEMENAVERLCDMLDDDPASESWYGSTDSWEAMVAEEVMRVRDEKGEEEEEELERTRIPADATAHELARSRQTGATAEQLRSETATAATENEKEEGE